MGLKKGDRHAAQWQPGQSGNPAGRKPTPFLREFRQIAKERCPEAIETLLRLLKRTKSDKLKAEIAYFIIEHGWGKATQRIEAEVKRELASISRDELLAIALGSGEGTAAEDGRTGSADSVH